MSDKIQLTSTPTAMTNVSPQMMAELKKGFGSFLPRIDLGQGLTESVKAGVIRQGEFALSNQNPKASLPLGTMQRVNGELQGSVSFAYIAYRAQAMHLQDNNLIAICHDYNDPLFQDIKAKSDSRSAPKGTKYSYGWDILVWVPPSQINFNLEVISEYGLEDELIEELKLIAENGTFATFFYKDTFRRYSLVGEPDVEIGDVIKICSELITNKSYSWWAPTKRFPGAFIEEDKAKAPSVDVGDTTRHSFLNPPKQAGEVIDDVPPAKRVDNIVR